MKKTRIELKWAVLFVIMQLLWMMLEKYMGLHGEHIAYHPIFTNLIAIPAIAFYAFAFFDKRRNDHGGTMNYKQGLWTGIKMTLFITVLTPFAVYLTHTLISPHYFDHAITYAVEEQGMTKEAAKGYFNFESYLKQGTLLALIMGLLTSAIMAYFTKKKA